MTSPSVIVCTRNQCSRLRLALLALACQAGAVGEIVVIDDASDDATGSVVEEIRSRMCHTRLMYVRNPEQMGSAASRNVGIEASSGDLLIFIDGDVLTTRGHVHNHCAFQRQRGPCLAFGPLWHTTTTEFLRDPIRGVPFDVPIPDHIQQQMAAHLGEMLISDEAVTGNFETIVKKSEPGSYPGLQWMEAEGVRLGDAEGHPAAWVLMTPQNASIPRKVIEDIGGFDAQLPFSEGWDLTLRIRASGTPVLRVADAPIYHLYHYRPIDSFEEQRRRWTALQMIAQKQNTRSLLLTSLLFRCRGGDRFVPYELAPLDLDYLAAMFKRYDRNSLGPYEKIVQRHPYVSAFESCDK